MSKASAEAAEGWGQEAPYCTLVRELFGPLGASVPAYAAAELVGVVGAVSHPSASFVGGLALISATMLARLALLVAYRRRPDTHREAEQLRVWEVAYALLAGLWALTLGLECGGLMMASEPAMQLFAATMAIGMTGGVAAKHSPRPWIVTVQVVAILIPYGAALATHGGIASYGLVTMTALMFAGVRGATRKIHANLLRALSNARNSQHLKERFDTALNNMSHGIVMFDRDKNVEVVNDRFLGMFNVTPGAVAAGTSFQEVVGACTANFGRTAYTPEQYVAMFGKAIDARVEVSRTIVRADGRVLEFKFHPTADGGSVVVMEDVTEKSEAAAKIEHLAHFDSLTGLANRTMFGKHIEAAANRAMEAEETFALLYVDLDGFKAVNDGLGHPVGDKLLVEVAQRLSETLRGSDRCFRMGGDEFVAVCQTRDDAQSDVVARRLIETISAPYRIDATEVRIGASIGLSQFSRDGVTGKELLKNADIALYKAKEAGRGTWRHFLPAMNAEAEERRELEGALRQAIEEGAIEMHYQPIVRPSDGVVASCEALLRWRHPTKGLIRPDKAIKIAEDAGLIVALGGLILRKACAEAAGWAKPVGVAVNLSATQFEKGVVVDQIRDALNESGLDPRRLEVEITESLALGNMAATRSAIERIRALGVRIALDDFGTGYTSLSYLGQIPFDKVKIDRSFVLALDGADRRTATSLIKLTAQFVKDLDKEIVVEGVETEAQLAILRGFGVDLIQGYLFSKPLPAAEAGELLAGGGRILLEGALERSAGAIAA